MFNDEKAKDEVKEVVEATPEATPEAPEVEAPEPVPEATPEEAGAEVDDIEVKDPEILKPKNLPLVITPREGSWKNDKQAEYAKVLNAYAYANPTKWKKKQAVLLARLREIGEDPSALRKYQGNLQRTKYGQPNVHVEGEEGEE